MKKWTNPLMVGLLNLAVVLASFGAAWAKYPERMISLVVPWPPGGRSDIIARILAPAMEKNLGKPVMVINKAGAGGVVGSQEVAAAKPDGYTILIISNTLAWYKYSVETQVDIKNFTPICQITDQNNLLNVHAKSPWNSLKEFVVHARSNPGKVKIGMTTIKGTDLYHLYMFEQAAGFRAIKVPYPGDAPVVAALAGQHIDALMVPYVSVMEMLAAKELRALGLAAEKRNRFRPDIQTFKEQGVDLVVGTFQGLYAPKGTASGNVAILSRTVERALRDPDVAGKLEKLGLGGELDYVGPKDFLGKVLDLDERYRKFTAEVGLK